MRRALDLKALLNRSTKLGKADAVLPCAPTKAKLPRLDAKGELSAAYMRSQIAKIHYAAFVTVYGPAPGGIRVEEDTVINDAGVTEIVFKAIPETTEPAALEWVEAFRAGLSKWSEACFNDPTDIDEDESQDNEPVWYVAPYKMVTDYARSQLRRRSLKIRDGERYAQFLTNLDAHLEVQSK